MATEPAVKTFVDHLAVTAPTLAIGADFIQQRLGVRPQVGGEHPRMGTHNLLLRLGDSLYLEVISPCVSMPPPGRPRWFSLDRLGPDSPAALSAWVVRTADIRKSVAAASEPLGEIEPMSRGALKWEITIPTDGSIPVDGVGPALIQWKTIEHPAQGLEERGLSLAELEIHHPVPERIGRLLDSLTLEAPVSVRSTPRGSAPGLVAHIRTPLGLRHLSLFGRQ